MYKFIYLFCNDVNEETPVQQKETKNPKTGDNIITYAVILILAAVGLYVVKRK